MEKQWKQIEAKCIVCGKLEMIQPTDKHYKKVKFIPDAPFICIVCRANYWKEGTNRSCDTTLSPKTSSEVSDVKCSMEEKTRRL